MRVLLTGGFGYLGGRLAHSLAAATDHDVVLGTRRIVPPHVSNANAIRIDWTNDADLERACKGINAIVHLAGMNAADCANNPVGAFEFNALGTARLVRAATLQRVTRFIYLSTAHVYGAALKGFVDEHTCPEPRHPYATSHRSAEDAVRFAHSKNAIEGIVVRLSNSFGAPVDSEADCWSLVTNDLCRQAVNTRRAVLQSAGMQRRDFVPVSEACRAIAHLLAVPILSVGDGVFNVGGGWAPTVLEVAEVIAERIEIALGFRPHIVQGTSSDRVGDRSIEYSVKKLLSTGFAVRPEATVEELDRLIAFCAQQRGALP